MNKLQAPPEPKNWKSLFAERMPGRPIPASWSEAYRLYSSAFPEFKAQEKPKLKPIAASEALEIAEALAASPALAALALTEEEEKELPTEEKEDRFEAHFLACEMETLRTPAVCAQWIVYLETVLNRAAKRKTHEGRKSTLNRLAERKPLEAKKAKRLLAERRASLDAAAKALAEKIDPKALEKDRESIALELVEILARLPKKDYSGTWLDYVRRALVASPCKPIDFAKKKAIIPSLQRRHMHQDFLSLDIPISFSPSTQRRLPGICTSDDGPYYTAPLLDLCNAAGVPIRRRGKGAPAELRVILFAILSVPVTARTKGKTHIVRPLFHWLQMLFPGDPTRKSKHWPVLRAALEMIDTFKIRMPDRSDWWPVKCHRLPTRHNPAMTDEIALSAYLPREVSDGPHVDARALARLGARNGRAFNAAIAGRSLLYMPGKTWIKTPQSRYPHGWTKTFERYPVLGLKDRRRTVFGKEKVGHRTAREVNAAWEHEWLPFCGVTVIDKKAIDPKRGIKGWRIIPTEIAKDHK